MYSHHGAILRSPPLSPSNGAAGVGLRAHTRRWARRAARTSRTPRSRCTAPGRRLARRRTCRKARGLRRRRRQRAGARRPQRRARSLRRRRGCSSPPGPESSAGKERENFFKKNILRRRRCAGLAAVGLENASERRCDAAQALGLSLTPSRSMRMGASATLPLLHGKLTCAPALQPGAPGGQGSQLPPPAFTRYLDWMLEFRCWMLDVPCLMQRIKKGARGRWGGWGWRMSLTCSARGSARPPS